MTALGFMADRVCAAASRVSVVGLVKESEMLRRRCIDVFFRRSNRKGHAVERVSRVFQYDSKNERGGEIAVKRKNVGSE